VTGTGRIRVAADLSDVESERLFAFDPDPFDTRHLALEWRPKDLHLLFELDEGPVSHVGLLRQAVQVGDRPVLVAGVGGVITVPDARRRGYAARLLRQALQVMSAEWRVEAGLLFCLPRMIPYYSRLGWRTVEQPVTIAQSAGPVISPLPVMVLPVTLEQWPDGPVTLGSLPW
jgi:GNAT superfamily N-acetyltransferase